MIHELQQTASNAPYLYAVVLMLALGVGLVLGVLKLRPMIDPLIVIGAVFAMMTPTTAAVLGFMKAQETHLSVNSRLDAFMTAERVEAHRKGTDDERARAQEVEKEKKS